MTDSYFWEYEELPTSMSELLNGHYIVNEDFLARVTALIGSDHYARFECGVMIEHDMLYFDFDRIEGISGKFAYQFKVGPLGYDLTDSNRFICYTMPEYGYPIALVDTEMFLTPDSWLQPEDHAPLCLFYNPIE